MILVVAAGLSAAWAWWRMSRPDGRGAPRAGKATRLIGFGGASDEAAGDTFVFAPSPTQVVEDDRPPPAMSMARLALAIALSSAVLVAATWAIGVLIKVQLDRYFIPGS